MGQRAAASCCCGCPEPKTSPPGICSEAWTAKNPPRRHSYNELRFPAVPCGAASSQDAGCAPGRAPLQAVPDPHSEMQSAKLLPLMHMLLSGQLLERAQ